ncbi:MAG: riboflavin synthase subunit alpha [Patescibacteria group bacterium]
MFSGIVQGMRPLVALESGEGLMRLTFDLKDLAEGLQIGASVSVSGVCLTAAEIHESRVRFDVMGETLAKTTVGSLAVGDEVDIERSVRVGQEIGGHRVSGHVTGVAKISKLESPPNNRIVTLSCNPAWMDFILPKGFIALDGCSLTVVDVGPDWFTVHLIPETLRITTFGRKTVGDEVNLELDPETQAIVETVKRYLSTHK